MKYLFVGLLIFVSGCVSSTPDQIQPIDGADDTGIINGEAYVENVDILILESFPVQIRAVISGYVSDSCTMLTEIVTHNIGNDFFVRVPTARNADAVCAQVETPFEKSVSLDVYGLPAGVYNVDVNGFDATFELQTDNILQG